MSKREQQCPECGEVLEVIDMAPCDDCGWDPAEIEHFHAKEHEYGKFEVYGSVLTLCNFCDVDFSSYDPAYWGFPKGHSVGYGTEGFRKIEEIPYEELSIIKGKVCPNCRASFRLIRAAQKAREQKRT